MPMPSLEDVQAQLVSVSGTLTMTLNEVLKRFKPDDYMSEQLERYLPEWGDKTLHEFMVLIRAPERDGDDPDILNGDMEPLNLLWVLSEFYDQDEQ